MISSVINVLERCADLSERYVEAHERHAAATERIAAVAESRETGSTELGDPVPTEPVPAKTEPDVEESPTLDAITPLTDVVKEAHRLIGLAKVNPFDLTPEETKYHAKFNNLLRDLLDLRFVEYTKKTKGIDLHRAVLAAYPEITVKSTENIAHTEEAPTECASDSASEGQGTLADALIEDFAFFKRKVVEFVGDSTENRKLVSDVIRSYGVDKASDVPPNERYAFLVKIGVE